MSTPNFQLERSLVGGGGGRRQPFGFLNDNTLVTSSSSSSPSSKRNSTASSAASSITHALEEHPSGAIFKMKNEEPTKNRNVELVISSIVTRSQARGMSSGSSSQSAKSKDHEVESSKKKKKKKKATRLLSAKVDEDDDNDCKRSDIADGRIIADDSSTSASAAASVTDPTATATLFTESETQAVRLPYALANDNSECVRILEDCASIFRQLVAVAQPNEDDDTDDFWGNGMEDMLKLRRANPIISEDADKDDYGNDDSSTDEGWQQMVDIFKTLDEDLLLDQAGSESGGVPIY